MDKEQAQKRIRELIDTLNKASKAYYEEAAEIITNYEYDAMYDELLALEEETGIVMADSPSVNVGYTIKSELPKVQHASRMLSLNKTKDRDELKAWLGDKEALLSWKLDGITVVLTYEDGKLARAVTRGNGDTGELITDNAKAFKNLPYTIPHKGETVVRGEAVIKYSDFDKINENIDDANAKYKNPRNLCSGSVRQLDPNITAERNVYFYAFTLSSAEDADFEGKRSNQMKWMSEQGFDTVEYVMVGPDNLLDEIDVYESKIPTYDIPSDGLVLTLEDLEYSSTLGVTAKYPKDSIAFKWRDQQAETVLREIEWSPSRTGLLNPVAVFDPVELEGTTVSRASVHNINIMEDLELGIGDVITVYKANMIIPQLSDNITRSGHVDIPKVCPVCGGNTEINDEGGTKTLMCTNPDCLAKHVKRFSLLASRDALNIDGLSEQGLLQFIGQGMIKRLPDIFDIAKYRDEIVTLEGWGDKSYDKLINSIEAARKTTPARLLYSLGIPGIGVATSKLIAEACHNKWDKIENLTKEDLMSIDKIGGIMSEGYLSYFDDEENKAAIKDLLERIELDESYKEGGRLAGKNFVITGSLEHYPSRNDLKAAIEAEGGKVSNSVGNSTDYLVTNDPNSGSAKNKDADRYGVSKITEDEIISMLS